MSDPDIEMLMNQCHADDPVRQIEALHKLLDLQAYAALPALIEALKSNDVVVRTTAARALGNLNVKDSEAAGPALLDLLDDPEVIVRSEAIDSLGILHYAPAVGAVKALLLNDPEPLVRASAAETLGDFGDANALAELELALRDTDAAVRGYAANSIGLLGTPAMLPKLQEYAEGEQSLEVKAELYGARYRIGAAGDLDVLLKLLEAADEGLAANVLNILNDLSSRNVPSTLAADAARIRAVMTTLAQRTPLLSADAEQVLARLAKLEAL
jgi:HEAT repeat protein